jgi:hypothetical protein
MRLSATRQRTGGVTLVTATLENDGPDSRRVRIESELDGPVWAPRREGVPAAGWDPEAGTVAVTLSPGERTGIGFATPAAPADPPVSIVDAERATPDGGIAASPAGVVRALGDPSPPGSAVPTALPDPDGDDGTPPDTDVEASESESADGTSDDEDRTSGAIEGADRPIEDGSRPDPGVGGYPAVTAWLSAVEERIECAQGDGTDSGTPPTADAKRLRTVARRAVELAERADGGGSA